MNNRNTHSKTTTTNSNTIPGKKERKQLASSVKWRETIDGFLTFAMRLVFSVIAVIVASYGAMMGLETAFNDTWSSVPQENMAYEFSVICSITTVVYLICQRKAASLALVVAGFTILGIAEEFVEQFKYSAILPTDLLNLETAMGVANGYNYTMGTGMLSALCLAGITILVVTRIHDPLQPLIDLLCRQRSNITRALIRIASIVTSAAAAVVIAMGSYAALYENYSVEDELGFTLWYWSSQTTYHEEGFIPSFVAALQDLEIEEPDGYSTEAAEALQEYLASIYDETSGNEESTTAAQTQFSEVQPNVVIIMNETFADLSTLANLGVGYEGLTFFNSWTDGVLAKGALTVSAYGGDTCNSEFEFLTGIPLAFLSAGATPYSQYDLTDVASLTKQLADLGYGTTAIHPNAAVNWKRSTVYPEIGFDMFITCNDGYFDDAETTRGYVSDAATYDAVIDVLTSSDEPQFVFDVTMQNHSPYDTGEVDAMDYESVAWLDFESVVDESIASETREYLASVKASDDDLTYLIEQINALDEPTIVVFYGDHQPGFTYAYTYLLGEDVSELEATQAMQQTVYAVYANYDVSGTTVFGEEGTMDTMSVNQLSTYVAELIGIPLSDYQKGVAVISENITSLNIYGYLDANGVWNSLDSSGSDAVDDGDGAAVDDDIVDVKNIDVVEDTGEIIDDNSYNIVEDTDNVDVGDEIIWEDEISGEVETLGISYEVTTYTDETTIETDEIINVDDVYVVDDTSDRTDDTNADNGGSTVGNIIANIVGNVSSGNGDSDDDPYVAIMAGVDTSNGAEVYNAITAIAEMKGTNPMLEMWRWISYLNFVEIS